MAAMACLSGKAQMLPYQDTTLSFHERAKDLVSRLSLEEKAAQMGNMVDVKVDRTDFSGNGRVSIPIYQYWNEALHGVARSGRATSFPESKAMSATWDRQLVYDCATVISDEARIYNNEYGKGLNYWCPTINMARDPRWGRDEENYGEDPYLAGQLAVMFVKGMQGEQTADNPYLKTVACAKHFAANNYERGRQGSTSFVSEHVLREYYLPAFEAAVKEGGVKSIMSAYNAVSTDVNEKNAAGVGRSSGRATGGKPCAMNEWLLTDILRNEWGFKGYVTSDCAGISCIYRGNKHKYFGDNDDGSELQEDYKARATAAAIKAGNDMNCEFKSQLSVYQTAVEAAIDKGYMTEADLDTALVRVMETRFALGEFDENVPWRNIASDRLECAGHQAMALKAAQEAIVLMKNKADNGPLLPLDKEKSVAIIGPYANAIMLGDYSGTPTYTVTPYQAFAQKLGTQGSKPTVGDGTVQFEDYSEIIACKRGESNLNKGNGYIENTSPGDELKYANVNFGKRGCTDFAMRCAAKNTGVATVCFYLDNDNSQPFLTIDNKDTGAWTAFDVVTAEVDSTLCKGVHDVYVKFVGSQSYCGNHDWFRFYRNTNDGTMQFEDFTQTVKASRPDKLNLGNGCLENTAPGDELKYAGVNFGQGATMFEMSAAAKDTGLATLSFYLDNDTTEPILTIDNKDTGAWTNYTNISATVDPHVCKGVHDVYVKFSGKQKYCGNYDWFRFYDPENPINVDEDDEEVSIQDSQLYYFATSDNVNTPATEKNIEVARRIAQKADVVVFLGGTNFDKTEYTGTESNDRSFISLPGNQEVVLKALLEVNPNVVLVLETNSSVDISWEKEHIPAIINAWYGGQAQGQAICDVIYGDVNPAGKLTSTWYNGLDELPQAAQSYYGSNGMCEYNIDEWGYTYMYYGRSKHENKQAKSPLFPFGFGLSYTTFEYDNLKLSKSTLGKDETIMVKADIINTGARDGDEIVQLYVSFPTSAVEHRPARKLVGFQRVSIRAGETKTVAIPLCHEQLAFFNEDTHTFDVEGGAVNVYVSAASDDDRLVGTINAEAATVKDTYLTLPTKIAPVYRTNGTNDDGYYDINGRFVGTSIGDVPNGIYINKGEKHVKKFVE